MSTRPWQAVALIVLGMMHGMAMAAPPRTERQQWLAVAAYLQMADDQVRALVGMRMALHESLQLLASQARALAAGTGAAGASAPDLAPICQRAQHLVAAHRQGLQALLTAPQRERLQQLERAFALMPMVEAAQAAGLMTDRLAVPPLGLPAGSVEVEHAWQRVLAPPLPGCLGTRVHRELDSPDGSGPRKPVR